jgi:hypothetical protein
VLDWHYIFKQSLSLEDMPSPDAIPSLDKTKYPQGINMVAQGNSAGKHYTLGSFDMSPA